MRGDKSLFVLLAILFVLMAIWFLWPSSSLDNEDKLNALAIACQENGGNWLVDFNECENISNQWCLESGGEFKACTSFCRHHQGYPEIPCTKQCVSVCYF
jgi:hypothetical protein